MNTLDPVWKESTLIAMPDVNGLLLLVRRILTALLWQAVQPSLSFQFCFYFFGVFSFKKLFPLDFLLIQTKS